jgi:hypothetical protein
MIPTPLGWMQEAKGSTSPPTLQLGITVFNRM